MVKEGLTGYDVIIGRRRCQSDGEEARCTPVPKYCVREFIKSLEGTLSQESTNLLR